MPSFFLPLQKQLFMDTLKNLAIGTGSIGGIEAVDLIPTDPNDVGEICKIACQVLVAVASLIALFRKKKK